MACSRAVDDGAIEEGAGGVMDQDDIAGPGDQRAQAGDHRLRARRTAGDGSPARQAGEGGGGAALVAGRNYDDDLAGAGGEQRLQAPAGDRFAGQRAPLFGSPRPGAFARARRDDDRRKLHGAV